MQKVSFCHFPKYIFEELTKGNVTIVSEDNGKTIKLFNDKKEKPFYALKFYGQERFSELIQTENNDIIGTLPINDFYTVDLQSLDEEALQKNSSIMLQPKPKTKKIIPFDTDETENQTNKKDTKENTSKETKLKQSFSVKSIQTNVLFSSICKSAIAKAETAKTPQEKYGILNDVGAFICKSLPRKEEYKNIRNRIHNAQKQQSYSSLHSALSSLIT